MQFIAYAEPVRPAHFVTPELDVHCERIIHVGDQVILEGNVLLLCKKHAQPIRIEAQRVAINMKDGSFTVDSMPRTITTSFGVQRRFRRDAAVLHAPYSAGESRHSNDSASIGHGYSVPTSTARTAAIRSVFRAATKLSLGCNTSDG